MNPSVDGYIRKKKKWQKELNELRRIILDSPLTEEVKWRVPVYTLNGKNVVFLGAMNEWCGVSFLKGVLMKDPKRILQLPGENTQTVRIVRFTGVQEILDLEPVLKAYIREAVELEKSGVKPKLKKITEHKVPDELQKKLNEDPAFKAAFRALTPGRQRGYMIYFAGAKQSKTREARIEKCTPRIMSGKGMLDE
jgi:uncharacterized protein YdeI (YjbR/CyaY-like superfamily)